MKEILIGIVGIPLMLSIPFMSTRLQLDIIVVGLCLFFVQAIYLGSKRSSK